MIPNPEQRKLLKDYLNKNLNYRETYLEFYDHILTALEDKPADTLFEDAMNNIIKEDFGGFEVMAAIETRYQRATLQQMKKKYLNYITAYFKFPLIGITSMFALLLYYVVIQSWFSFIVFLGVFFTMRFMPSIIKGVRYFKSGYTFANTKASVKDNAYIWLDYIAAAVLLLLFFLLKPSLLHNSISPVVWFKNTDPIIIALVLFSCALHTLTYYRVYRDEFKVSIVNN